ncbi:nucleoporin Nup85-like protein [Gorgonomyces haynaldii]|nr:nucleoporin Nup85-like protein [Gorgonomyces haynaldii]
MSKFKCFHKISLSELLTGHFHSIFLEQEQEWNQKKLKTIDISRLMLKEIYLHAEGVFGQDEKEAQMFAGLHCIWHLGHIMLFDAMNGYPLLDPMVEWVSMNHRIDLQNDFEQVTALVVPSSDPKFWPLVYRCMLRGHHDAVKSLLRTITLLSEDETSNTPFLSSPIKNLYNLMETIPKFVDADSLSHFKTTWAEWKREAKFIYADGALSSLEVPASFRENLSVLFGILAGDESKILQASSQWQDALLGLLHYTLPTAEAKHCKSLLDLIPDHLKTEMLLDQIQFALLELDIPSLVVHVSSYDLWMTAHLIDLIEKAGLIGKQILKDLPTRKDCSLSQWHHVLYAEWIGSEPQLWRATLDYLRHGGELGKQVLDNYLSHQQPLLLGNDLLEYCEKHQLSESKKTIHLVLGRHYLDHKDYRQAITHYLQGRKLGMVELIVTRLIEDNQTAKDYGFIDSLAPSVLGQSPSLQFLARYKDFQKMYAQQDYKNAGKLLVLLLQSGAAPKSTWRMLLLDALPLLEGPVLVFSVQETRELMRCLEDLDMKSMYRQKAIKDAGDLMPVRLALVRNMARAMVMGEE